MKRIQKKNTKGWRMPKNSVYVGSSSKWKNPFRVGGEFMLGDLDNEKSWMKMIWCEKLIPNYDPRFTRIENKQQSVEMFKKLMSLRPIDVKPLKGKILVCQDADDEPSHADVLLDMVNNLD